MTASLEDTPRDDEPLDQARLDTDPDYYDGLIDGQNAIAKQLAYNIMVYAKDPEKLFQEVLRSLRVDLFPRIPQPGNDDKD